MVRELVEDLVGRERVDRAVLQTEHAGHVVRDGADVVGDEQDGDAGLDPGIVGFRLQYKVSA